MGLFDLVKHEHRMRRPHYRLGQQPALIEADVPGRGTDEPRDRVRLGVFAHVETDEFDTEDLGKLFGHFGLADAGRAGEQERADGFGLRVRDRHARSGSRRRSRSIASSCPKITFLMSAAGVFSRSFSLATTVFGGIFAMRAMVFSTIWTVTFSAVGWRAAV